MRSEGLIEPVKSAFDIVGLLNACAIHKDLRKGCQIHSYIREHAFLEKNSYVASTLVNMYAKCGELDKAQQALKELPVRNVVTWSALIGGYNQQGQGEEALKCFDKMLYEGHSPDAVTFTCALKACGSIGASVKGKQIHDTIVSLGMLAKNVELGTALIDMYAKCGALAKAQHVLEGLPVRDAVTWNALIAGYAQQGKGEEALKCFDIMQHEGYSPDVVTFTAALKACGNIGAAAKGEQIHNIISLDMLENSIGLGNTLIDMYARCGALAKAQMVLKGLPVQDVVSWNALIAGYAHYGQGEEALKCYDCMLCEGHSPDVITFTCVLKACGSIGSTAEGERIHEMIVTLGVLKKNIVLGCALVDMYARCSALAKAQQVLDGLHARNVVTWNALIAGYVQQGQGEEALKCFDCMQLEGHSPDAVTFTCALKACGSVRATVKGEDIHTKVVTLGMLEKNIVLGNTLLDMYAKCGALVKAQQVLEGLPVRNVVTWNALLAGYAQGKGEEALKWFDSMQHEGHTPDPVTFTGALRACGNIGAAAKVTEIYDKIVSLDMLKKNIILGSTLVDMYAKCGALATAEQVFQGLPVQNGVTWNTLMAGYAHQEQAEEVLKCFDNMQHEGQPSDAVTFTCALKACGSIGAIARGLHIHNKIVNLIRLEKSIELGNTLVDMYARCGAFAKAQKVLEGLPVRNVITWNALIAGYAQEGKGEEALKCYDSMQHEGHSPDSVTCTCALKACGSIGAITKGEEIHDKLVSLAMLEENIVLGSALVDMYARCRALVKAQQVLEGLPVRNVVTWNALITGYAQQGQGKETLKCFDSMQLEGHSPDAVTFICALKVCVSIGAAAKGKEIHDMVHSLGMLEKDIELGCTLVDMYAKSHALEKALQVVEALPVQNVVTWNVLISGYLQQGEGEEVLKCFDGMQCNGHSPDVVTFIYALKACGIIGAVAKGKQIHEKIVHLGLLEKSIELGTALVDMFAKFAAITEAEEVFKGLPFQNVITWNVLIGGYAQQGQSSEALEWLEKMQSNGAKPDTVTLLCVLNACRHSGQLDLAERFFSRMSTKYGITPDMEHCCCMIYLFGHALEFNKALMVIEKMPSAECLPAWISLLGVCRNWGELVIGRLAFEHACDIDRSNEAAYVCMLNIYTAAGMLEHADKIEVMRVANQSWSLPGCYGETDDMDAQTKHITCIF